jgi:uncharacterized membrane protein YfcA
MNSSLIVFELIIGAAIGVLGGLFGVGGGIMQFRCSSFSFI